MLDRSYPERSTSSYAQHHRRMRGPTRSAHLADLQDVVVTLAAWIRKTRGFQVLLDARGLPLVDEDLAVLRVLGSDGDLSVNVLARHLEVDHSLAGRRLARLAKHGYVTHAAHPADGRVRLYRATEPGLAVLHDILALQRQAFELVAPPLPARHEAELTSLLWRFAGTTRNAPGSTVPPTADG